MIEEEQQPPTVIVTDYLNQAKTVFSDWRDRTYRGTRWLTLSLIIGALFSLSPAMLKISTATAASALLEAKFLKLVTSFFVEANLISAIFHIPIAFVCGTILEPEWSTRQFLLFVAFVGAFSEFIVVFGMIFAYYATFDEEYLLTPISGFSGVIGGFAVGIAQLWGEKQFHPSVAITFQYLPFTCVVCTGLGIIFRLPSKFVMLVSAGAYAGWLRQRFYGANPKTGEKGDDREEFALAQLFPPVIRIPVQLLSYLFYSLSLFLGCCSTENEPTKPAQEGIVHHNDKIPFIDPEIPEVKPPLDPAAQERRAKAIQDVEDRLKRLREEMQETQMNKVMATTGDSIGVTKDKS